MGYVAVFVIPLLLATSWQPLNCKNGIPSGKKNGGLIWFNGIFHGDSRGSINPKTGM